MCNQTVGLLAGLIESAGIPTVCVMLLRFVAERVAPPRSLVVPFGFGYPLGPAHEPVTQTEVIRAALGLLPLREEAPVLREWSSR